MKPMDVGRYAEVKAVFRAACERPPEERSEFLTDACADDPELLAEVESLLAHATGHPGLSAIGAHSPPAAEERFLPGTILAGRYRIVGLLGRGGMGEVYRADDVTLRQPVALKFLPHELGDHPAWLARLRDEVRLARQVTHPNVCRVYDLCESDGTSFISMEFVDGEDLTSLQRRIGRLPSDKAGQIARQLCAGLAAAHERGVLHRDLKPANIMLDGRGQVRITDFGLAAFAADAPAAEAFFGTPAYIAPERITGGESTAAGDLYSLGLVLYELHTGVHPFAGRSVDEQLRCQREELPAPPSTHVPDIDPEVERVIVGCLQKDARDRPGSALEVAASFPAEDLLAAAVSRGETPSPGLVAAAGPSGGMRFGWAAASLGVFFVFLLLATLLHGATNLLHRAGLDEKSPQVLRDRADSIVRELGYERDPADIETWFQEDRAYLAYLRSGPPELRERIDELPGVVRYWYRSDPEIEHYWPYALASGRNRSTLADGLVTLSLDPRGRLVFLRAHTAVGSPVEATPPEPDWSGVFRMAGLDLESFEPTGDPSVWAGPSPDDPELRLRVAGTARDGRIVSFRVTPMGVALPERVEPRLPHTPAHDLETIVSIVLTALGLVLVWINLRRGRGDVRGAVKVALFVFAAHTIRWLVIGKHSADATVEYSLFVLNTGYHLYLGFQYVVFYLALEPYVRKHWPTALIPWSRLLNGRFRDPLVARNVLVGSSVGSVLAVVHIAKARMTGWTGPPSIEPISSVLENLGGVGRTVAVLIHDVSGAVFLALTLLGLIVLPRMVLRVQWVAVAVFAAVVAVVFGHLVSTDPTSLDYAQGSIVAVTAFLLFSHCGLLAVATAFFVQGVFQNHPVTLDTSAWYFASSVVALGTLAAGAVWAFRVCAIPRRPEEPG